MAARVLQVPRIDGRGAAVAQGAHEARVARRAGLPRRAGGPVPYTYTYRTLPYLTVPYLTMVCEIHTVGLRHILYRGRAHIINCTVQCNYAVCAFGLCMCIEAVSALVHNCTPRGRARTQVGM